MTDDQDRRPHSRACGIVPHDHNLSGPGPVCNPNCPTCQINPETPDAHMVETLRLRTAALHRVQRSNDQLRRENDDLRAQLTEAKEAIEFWMPHDEG